MTCSIHTEYFLILSSCHIFILFYRQATEVFLAVDESKRGENSTEIQTGASYLSSQHTAPAESHLEVERIHSQLSQEECRRLMI